MSSIDMYEPLHKSFNGPGDHRPTAMQIVQDQGLKGKWTDKTILVTGCTAGIGIETARAMYTTGAKVVITARNMTKGNEVAKELSTDASRPVEVLEMSLDSLYFASELDRRYGSRGLHALSVHPGSILTELRRHLRPDNPLLAAMSGNEE